MFDPTNLPQVYDCQNHGACADDPILSATQKLRQVYQCLGIYFALSLHSIGIV